MSHEAILQTTADVYYGMLTTEHYSHFGEMVFCDANSGKIYHAAPGRSLMISDEDRLAALAAAFEAREAGWEADWESPWDHVDGKPECEPEW